MLVLPVNCANSAWMSNGHGELGSLWCVASSIGIIVRAVGCSGREKGAFGWGKTKRVRDVFPVYLIRPRNYA